jgi:hypothetical protein
MNDSISDLHYCVEVAHIHTSQFWTMAEMIQHLGIAQARILIEVYNVRNWTLAQHISQSQSFKESSHAEIPRR